MIKNIELWEKWEKEYCRRQKPDFMQNLKIFEALYLEAQALGVLHPANPLQGIETKINLARKLNVSGTSRKNRTGN